MFVSHRSSKVLESFLTDLHSHGHTTIRQWTAGLWPLYYPYPDPPHNENKGLDWDSVTVH